FQKQFKFNLVKKFECLNGLMLNQENRTLLNEIYTELYITEGDSGDVNKEHEVKQIEAALRRNPTKDKPIKCSDIFKPLPEQDKAISRVLTKPLSEQDEEPIRNVLTKGVAGIGKTVSVQKFVLDWADGKTNQDVQLIFPLPFRELNLMKDQKLSLIELLHVFFKEMKELDISRLEKVLFIFDGLDECRFPLDFQKTVRVCDVTESAPVHVLLINLIKGNLLPSALIWITSRPAAASQIPSECVHRVTEVRGFNDPQKEEYFRKRISDQNLANKIITHLKSLRSLYIMCHIPVFCWISADVLERMLGEAESGEIPKTLTQMYTHFLIIQTNIIREKYLQKQESDEEMLLKLGKLRNVLKQNQVCRTLSDVHMSAVDQALKCQTGHLDLFLRFLLGLSLESNQKLLHALVTQTGSRSQNKEETVQYIRKKISEDLPAEKSINLFHCLNELGDDSLVEEIQQYLKSGAQRELSPSQWSALVFVLLTSAQDLEEFDLNKYITPDKIRDEILVRVMPVIAAFRKAIIRCSEIAGRSGEALTSVLNSETSSLRELHLTVNTLDVSGNKLEDSGVKRLSALLENPECKVEDLRLGVCGVSDEGCAALASALRSNPSHLRELNLTRNKVGDSGVKCVSAVLENPHCKLEILRHMRSCMRGWTLRKEKIIYTDWPGNVLVLQVRAIKDGEGNVLRKIREREENERVKCVSLCICRLGGCEVSDEGCAALASALRSNPSHLRELILSGNKVGNSGVKFLSAGLENSHCKLEILRLCDCGVSDEGCAALASALRSNPSHLRDLNLSGNKVGDSGVKCLSAVLENPHCKLETLRELAQSISQLEHKIIELQTLLQPERTAGEQDHVQTLTTKKKKLSDLLGLKVQEIERVKCVSLCICRLGVCGVSDEGCAALASALRSNPSHLRELILSQNKVGDSGVKCLSAVLENPHCKLETLRLMCCGVSDEGCAALASALRSNPSFLRELDLSGNKVGDSGRKFLSDLKDDERYKLQTLK
ncbi:NACHT, LRR and PYD domains-containing protein 12 isoform X19, partial [Silurus meridionalis]